jgi:hypothetical protein
MDQIGARHPAPAGLALLTLASEVYHARAAAKAAAWPRYPWPWR